VNNIKSGSKWSYWETHDPNIKSTYEGPESGKGAIHHWESEHRRVGKGTMTYLEVHEPEHIVGQLSMEGMSNNIEWKFAPADSGTKTSLGINMDMPFYTRFFPGLFMENWIGEDFEKNLSALKTYMESQPRQPEMKTWIVEEVNTPSLTVLTIRTTTPATDISATLGQAYGKLTAEMQKQGLSFAGPPLAIYHSYSDEKVDIEAGLQVNKPGKSSGDINAKELPATKALKVDYFGPYNNLKAAYSYIDQWIKNNNKTVTGPPWEAYVTDPGSEPDSSKWLTQIYYPIQ
jgi:effector-binding domain-containing protein